MQRIRMGIQLSGWIPILKSPIAGDNGMNGYTNKKKNIIIGVLIALGIALLITGVVFLFDYLERRSDVAPEGAGLALSREGAGADGDIPAGGDPDEGEINNTLFYNGKQYEYNDSLVSLLIMGTDKRVVEEYISSENDSHVDFLILAVFDPDTRTCTILQLNRDTMCQVYTMKSDGVYDYFVTAQLAYAHAVGNGLEESCENTVKTVSTLLYGVKIDNYFALTMDAIPTLNDLVGGVTVTIEDDFSGLDPTLVMGETVKLTSENVEHYVRYRREVGDGTNTARMRRQREYMTGLFEAMRTAVQEKQGFVLDAYGAIAKDLVTDCTINDLSDYANRFSEYTLTGFVTPEGELVEGEKYMEFYVDEEALQELVIDIFYKPVD